MAKIRQEEAMDTPVSSMIDVVFLLIIFFVVTASIDEDIVDETIKLAQADNVPAVVKKHPLAVTINVDTDGKMNIATLPMTKSQVRSSLIAQVNKYGNQFPVVIRASGEALFKHVDSVMEVVGQAGLYRVRISAVSNK